MDVVEHEHDAPVRRRRRGARRRARDTDRSSTRESSWRASSVNHANGRGSRSRPLGQQRRLAEPRGGDEDERTAARPGWPASPPVAAGVRWRAAADASRCGWRTDLAPRPGARLPSSAVSILRPPGSAARACTGGPRVVRAPPAPDEHTRIGWFDSKSRTPDSGRVGDRFTLSGGSEPQPVPSDGPVCCASSSPTTAISCARRSGTCSTTDPRVELVATLRGRDAARRDRGSGAARRGGHRYPDAAVRRRRGHRLRQPAARDPPRDRRRRRQPVRRPALRARAAGPAARIAAPTCSRTGCATAST